MNEKTKDLDLELKNCNFAKTILMIIIVFYHSIVFWAGFWFTANPIDNSKVLEYLAIWLNSFHIYAFTLISGYIFYYLKYEKGRYGNFLSFVNKKIKRLIVPYIFVTIVWAMPVYAFFFNIDMDTIINKFVLGTVPITQLWFSTMLFGVFIFSWILSDMFAKKNFLGLAIAIGFYILGMVGERIIPNIFSIWTICKYIIFFWLGFKIRQYGSIFIRKIPILVWIIVDILVFGVIYYFFDYNDIAFYLLSFLLNIIGAIMAFVVLQKVAGYFNWEESKSFNFLSKRSMAVYLFHQQLIYFIIYWLNGVVNAYLNAMANFIFSFVISLIISSILMKFKITRFLIGEK